MPSGAGLILAFVDPEAPPMERSARVRFGAAVRCVRLAFVPEAAPGDYVLVHAGVALAVLDEAAALAALQAFAALPPVPAP